MKYLSLCSGIEAATVAWHPLGWEAVAYSEIERFPSEVLTHHYPNTPNLGDMTKFKEWTNVSDVDLLVGGTPCQSFSVAGLRKGLDDPRGNLMLTYLAIADKYRPRWLVWENVPGVLSSNSGKDFGVFLGALGELGYGFAYRVLDAQYYGVAQRRRRVFVVGYLGDWRAAAAVLFERHSLQGHPAPSREKRQSAAASVGAGTSSRSWPADISSRLDTTFGTKQGLENQHINAGCPMFVPAQGAFGKDIADTVTSKFSKGAELLQQGAQNGGNCVLQPVYEMHGQDSRVRDLGETCSTVTSKWGTGGGNVPVALQPIAFTTEQTPKYNHDQALTLTKQSPTGGGQPQCVAQAMAYNIAPGKGVLKDDIHVTDADTTKTLDASGSNPAMHQGGAAIVQPIAFSGQMSNPQTDVGITQTLQAKNPMAVMQAMAVRRLTPIECERLQGFPDSYTDIKSKNKPTPDGPRYKALGNSMAVPVMAWIGQRIEQVEAICKQNR
jgi:DNA (cytosine-5)-methyltransferase 1